STLALATEAIVFSVAGSITSKRAPSEALRHLPPIQRSVGTLASRLSYMAMSVFSTCSAHSRESGNPVSSQFRTLGPRFPKGVYARLQRAMGTSGKTLTLQRPPHRFGDPIHRRQHGVLERVGGGQRNVRRRDAHRGAVEVVEGLVGDDRDD